MRSTIVVLFMVSVFASVLSAGAGSPADTFVSRRGDRLFVGEQEFRFISFNIPNLHYVEDDLAFDQTVAFRWPDKFEIEDALESVRQMGGQVVRTYTLSVRKDNDPRNMPRHVLAPGRFDERAFETLDLVMQIARQKNIRIVVPFVDNWKWWGGVPQYAAFRGKEEKAFWTDPQLIADFKKTVHYMINRVNSRTGIAYRDDPTILAWETGNELHCPEQWTRQITAYIKQLDSKHLVLDGRHEGVLKEGTLANPNVDLVQTHHYEKDPRQMIGNIRRSAAMARGRKPYIVGEFGFIGTEAMLAVMDAIIEERAVGGLAWSLRYHSRDGGFFWHQEPHGGDLFKAYHWPGFESGEAYDETRMLALMRAKAYAISGREVPPLPAPGAPNLINVSSGAQLTWQGSAGASGYDVQRSDTAGDDWVTVGYNVSDARVQYRPLFVDSRAVPGQEYCFRVIARNASGPSTPSKAMGPVKITHRTLVDELWNEGRMFYMKGELSFHVNESRKFKEDAHRLGGEKGASVLYRVGKPLVNARFFAFAERDGDHFNFQVSADGKQFVSVDPEITAVDVGDAKTYGFWAPIQYRIGNLPPGLRFVRVEFLTNAQLARVELDYDRCDAD